MYFSNILSIQYHSFQNYYLDRRNVIDQTYSCPRDWRLSASGGPNWGPPWNSPCIIALSYWGNKGYLTWAPKLTCVRVSYCYGFPMQSIDGCIECRRYCNGQRIIGSFPDWKISSTNLETDVSRQKGAQFRVAIKPLNTIVLWYLRDIWYFNEIEIWIFKVNIAYVKNVSCVIRVKR